MANELTYQSVFTGQEMDERFTAVAQLQAALLEVETALSAKYVKPASGIPETDLDSAVQSALAKARSAVQDLSNYYTKTEIDSLLAAVNSQEYVDVATLPTASASTLGKIYLVGPTDNQYDRYYTSYDGSDYSWVAAGSTEINLSNYATKAELNQLDQEVVIHSGIAKNATQPNGFKSGLYWYNNNGVVGHLDSHSTMSGTVTYIPVKGGDKILFSVNATSTQVYAVFTDDSNNVISTQSGQYLADAGGELLTPSGATRVYFNTLAADIETSYVVVNGSYLGKMLGRIDELENSVSVRVSSPVQNGKGVNASTGAYADVSSQKAISVDLTKYNAKYISFVFVVSSTYGYGFFVNNVWQGKKTSSFPSGVYYERVKIAIPEGATEFRMSWSTSLYSGDNIPIVFISDAMDIVWENIAQLSTIYRNELEKIDNLIHTGGLLLAGTFNDNATYGHIELALNGSVSYKSFTFKRTYVNPSTYYCYGFVVGSAFVGYAGNASAGETPADITIQVPEGATSFRLCWNRNQIADASFTLSASATNRGKIHASNRPVFQFTPDFVLSRVPSYESPTEAQANALTPAALYALYDALVTSYPDYITKVDCDVAAQSALGISAPEELNGLPIYMYKFSPKIGGDVSGNDHTSRVKVFVTSMHPQEKYGLYSMYYTMKMICENWANDVNAEQLRSLVDIYVMPCPWPWNMQNGSRVNYDGVNANRNFPTRKWQVSGSGGNDYTGPEPLSEYEAKVINYYLLQIAPDVCLDVHTSGNDAMGHMGVLLVNQYEQTLVDLCGVIARTTSNRVIQDDANFPSSPDTCLYGVYPEDGSGKGEFYEYAFEQGCKYSILSEESPHSMWQDGVLDSHIHAQYTDGIMKMQVQYIFNTILRLTRQACVQYYL